MSNDDRSSEKSGYWMAQHHCASCGNLLGERERMYSGGVCPYCGFDSGSTICDTVNRPVFVETKTFLQQLARIFS